MYRLPEDSNELRPISIGSSLPSFRRPNNSPVNGRERGGGRLISVEILLSKIVRYRTEISVSMSWPASSAELYPKRASAR